MLVAVSGGADSTALLLALCSLARELGLEICAAHLNHRLRGADSDADQAWVAALCARLGVRLHDARWDTRARMRRRGLSGENGLRVLRREFLAGAAKRVGAGFIATAHTADDQMETVLMRLVRGSGLRGLGGMRPRTGPWIKPLLDATREDVEADLRAAGVAWREDATNDDRSIARNRVRHGVVPALLAARTGATSRAGLARRVSRMAAELRSVERALLRMVGPLPTRLPGAAPRDVRIPVAEVRRLPAAARRALFGAVWRRVAPGPDGLTAAHLVQLERLAGPAKGPVALPRGFVATRQDVTIRLGPARIQLAKGSRRPGRAAATSLQVPGCAVHSGLRVDGRWTSARSARDRISVKGVSEEYFAAEGIRGGLEVRSAHADEAFVPFGRRRPIRLREYLKRLPAGNRTSPPTVLADDSGILWVIGVRRSARAPVQPTTRRVLCVHAERHD